MNVICCCGDWRFKGSDKKNNSNNKKSPKSLDDAFFNALCKSKDRQKVAQRNFYGHNKSYVLF